MSDYVWVAARAILLKGATIATVSIIGAGAGVPKIIYPDNCSLAKNPAKLLKSGTWWLRSRLGKS
jgi:maltose O-acetyltransferase